MNASFNKYRHAFLIGLQGNIVYRWNFALRGGFTIFHLIAVLILWTAAYAGNPHIGGFDVRQTMTYFILLVVLQYFIGSFNEDYQVSEEIRNGLINQFLLKPINYFLYRFSIFTAARLVSGLLILVPLALAFPVLHSYITFPGEAWRLVCGLPAALLAGLIQFTLAYCFGLLTFWFLEIHGFVILSFAVEALLGGQIFPLDLMPHWLFRLSQFLPFYYQMYFPSAILTGRIGFGLAVQGLALQAAWLVLLLGFSQLLWRRGLRRHTAVGG